jgi:hypothetical protein
MDKSDKSIWVGEDIIGMELELKKLSKPIRIKGHISHGFGRGSRQLGFPTANIPISSSYLQELRNIKPGVYAGYAVVESSKKHHNSHHDTVNDYSNNIASAATGGGSDKYFGVCFKAAVNVGYSPTFEGKENPEKTVEAYLIRPSFHKAPARRDDLQSEMQSEMHQLQLESLPENRAANGDKFFATDFYGHNMKLSLVGFLRPEAKFSSIPLLITKIKEVIVPHPASLSLSLCYLPSSSYFFSNKFESILNRM